MPQESGTSGPFWRSPKSIDGFLIVLTILAIWVAYAPALGGGFIWDDNTYVRDNAALRSLSGLWQIWSDPQATPQYHPLVFTSFWLEYHLWGLSPRGYHAVNVALHCLNTLLLWRLLDRLSVPGAVLAAILFALHPTHVESVAWISERKDVLSVAFALLATLAWLRFVHSHSRRDYAAVLLLSACTLLSKFVLCTLPLCMLLLACWREPAAWRRHARAVLPLLLLAIPLGLLAASREYSYGHPASGFGPVQRLLIAARALLFYAWKLLWPVGLTSIYPKWEVDAGLIHAWIFPMLAVAAMLALWRQRQRWGWGPLVGVACFVVLLAPQTGLVDFNLMRLSFVFDHFQYLASAGLIALAAAAVVAAAGESGAQAAAVVLLVVLSGLTFQQSAIYRDAETFWSDNIAQNPESWMGHSNLAGALVTAGRFEEALPHFAQAAQLNPSYATAQSHWGIVLDHLGRLDEAVEHYEAALHIDPRLADAHNNLGVTLTRLGRLAEAEAQFAEAVRLNPDYVAAHHHWGIVASQLGERERAIDQFEEVLRLQPGHAGARASLQQLTAGESP